MRRLLMCLVLVMALPFAARAQSTEPAVLVADTVEVTQTGLLVARGNVEALQGTQRLRAQQISYNRATGALSIVGPITLQDGDQVTILADAAELSPDLQNGLLTGARMVMNQQLQLAAVQINRTQGRYTQLYKTAVTSCRVCDDGRPPLWQIRAKRVIHDKVEKQLYFDHAQLRIKDVPILYTPRLRLPDPSLKRATGFLIPSIRSTSQLGTGLKLPYFIRLGDHRDLPLTPYLSSSTRTLEYRYRQKFQRGQVEFDGAYTQDDLIVGRSRFYLFGDGAFHLGRNYLLTFDVEVTSDDAYLLDYGYSNKDRLDSEIAISRTRRDAFFRIGLIGLRTLRDGEDNSLIPTVVGDLEFERRYPSPSIGGEIRVAAYAHTHFRSSDADILGRDMDRITASAHWVRNWSLRYGLQANTKIGFAADAFNTRQDSRFVKAVSEFTTQGLISLRYPMVKRTAGATTFLEPIVQVAWSSGSQANIPNDESQRVEFDQGNLLSLSRFPAPDRREYGRVTTIGLNWARYADNGWQSHLSFGQIRRTEALSGLGSSSGLGGTTSDFLLAGQLITRDGLALTGRSLFDESFDFSKAELRADWVHKKGTLAASYVWLNENGPDSVSELTLDNSYRFSRHWTAKVNTRYDLRNNEAASAGIGLLYRNECIEVDLSLKRRFTASTTVEPSTDFGFTVALKGFNAQSGTERYVQSCKN